MPRLRYCGYVRVSDDRQLDGYSIEAQKAAIQAYVDREKGILVEWYEDGGISATSTRGRDEFHRMRADAKRGLFDALVVHKLDRLARNRLDAASVKIMLRKDLGIKVLSASGEPTADSDPIFGPLIEGIMEAMHEWYSINLGQEVKKVRQLLLQNGKWYGKRPYGYQKNEDTGILEPHPTEADVVRWMFSEYAKGKVGFKQMALMLNMQGHRTVAGRGFTKGTMQSLLQSPTYIGMLRHQEVRKDANNKRTFSAPITYHPGKHEPLVSVDLFEKCQQVMKSREHNIGGYSLGQRYLLAGLVYCSACMADYSADMENDTRTTPLHVNLDYAGKMYGRTIKGRDKVTLYSRYMCRAESGHGGCSAEHIEKQLLDFLMSDKLPQEWKNEAVHVVEQDLTLQSIQERIDQIKQTVNRMDFRFDRGFIQDIGEYEQQRQALQDELDILLPKVDNSHQLAVSIINDFRKHWEDCQGDFKKQQTLIGMIVERVYVRDKNLEAVMLKPDYRYVFPDVRQVTEHDRPYRQPRSSHE